MYGQTPQFARAHADDMSEHQKTLCFVGQNEHVHNHGFHVATRSLATCALNVTTTSSSTTS